MTVVLKKKDTSRRLLNLLKISQKMTKNLEKVTQRSLGKLFRKIEKMIQKIINNKSLPLLVMDKIKDFFTRFREKYSKILYTNTLKASKLGKLLSLLMINMDNKINPKIFSSIMTSPYFEPDKKIVSYLRDNSFNASKETLTRLGSNINELLSKSYKEGLTSKEISTLLKNEFTKLKKYEAARIARTEINSARNISTYNQYKKDHIRYHRWYAYHDDKTRPSHTQIHNTKRKIGQTFPNGLRYPGDKKGPIKEWINCRCTTLPVINGGSS